MYNPLIEDLGEIAMKGLETGKDKIQKICDQLKKETLEPARQEAREIIENGRIEAEELLSEAKKKAEELLAGADQEIEEKKRVFQASLKLACRQGIEDLKQKIESELFNNELISLVQKETSDPKLIAHLLDRFLKSMEEKGIEEEFTAVIPKEIPPRSITALLASKTLEKLQNKVVAIGDFHGGVQIQIEDQKMTIDISDAVVREIIAAYIRKDLRDLIFNS